MTITEKEDQGKGGISMREKAIIQVKLLTRVLSIVTFILSLPVLGSVIWLLYMRGYDCETTSKVAKIANGHWHWVALYFLVSNSVAFLQSRFPMAGLVIVMAP
ncbi:hypothetical protein SLA2020_453100 [Shorea laevis]